MASGSEHAWMDAAGVEQTSDGKWIYHPDRVRRPSRDGDASESEKRAYARGDGEHLQRRFEIPTEGFEGVLKWLAGVGRDVHRIASLEFPGLRYYPLATREEFLLRQFYRGLLSQICLRSDRPEGVMSHQIASVVSRSLVDYLFQDVRVRDRPYIGVRTRLEDWKYAKEIDSKGRSTAKGDKRVAKLFTRLEKLVKDAPLADLEKSEVRSVADIVDPDTGKTYMYDLKTGEIL